VMQLHGLGIDNRLQSRVVIRQRGEFVGHDFSSKLEDECTKYKDSREQT
jgi:hypothetical protein